MDKDETSKKHELLQQILRKGETATIAEIQELLKKKAVIFDTGGKIPTKKLLESWIGSVQWQHPDEELPLDSLGQPMLPIATIFLTGLPYCPAELQGIELITIFMSAQVWGNLIAKDLSPWFTIRTYGSLETLVPCEYTSDLMKPFPLIPKYVENDFPVWDGGGIPSEIEDIIIKMEDVNGIDYHEDIYVLDTVVNHNEHKIGGYPAFCQSGFWFGDNYPFVLQIASDNDARFRIVDGGNFYFYYNQQAADWKVYCDFY